MISRIVRTRQKAFPWTRKPVRWVVLLLCLSLPAGLGFACTGRDTAAPPEEPPSRPPVELRADVDRAVASPGEPVTFRITLDSDPRISVSLPDEGSRIQGFRIVDMGREDPKKVEGRIKSERWYRLEADLAGSYVLPALKIPYTDPDGKEVFAETKPIFVEVKLPETPEPKGVQATDIRDLKPLAEIQRPIPVAWILCSAGSLAVALGLAGWLLYRRKRRRTSNVPPSAEVLARRELENLEASGLLEEERPREYVFGLSLIFRRYLERKLAVPAAEQTTEEILASLRGTEILDERLKRSARALLEDTDPVKYRGLEPQGPEIENWRTQLLSFVDQAASLGGSPETIGEAA